MMIIIIIILLLLVIIAAIIYSNRDLLIIGCRSSVSTPPTTWQLPILGHLARLHPQRPFETVARWGWTQLGEIFRLNFGGQQIIILNSYKAIREAYIRQSDVFCDRPDIWLFTELQVNILSLIYSHIFRMANVVSACRMAYVGMSNVNS